MLFSPIATRALRYGPIQRAPNRSQSAVDGIKKEQTMASRNTPVGNRLADKTASFGNELADRATEAKDSMADMAAAATK